jgi:hypothetical protein
MVPKGGFEPPRGLPTTPSRWRVYQFHHFGNLPAFRKVSYVLQLCGFAVLQFERQHCSTAIRQHFLTSLARLEAPEAGVEHPTIPQELIEPVFLSLTKKLALKRQRPEGAR